MLLIAEPFSIWWVAYKHTVFFFKIQVLQCNAVKTDRFLTDSGLTDMPAREFNGLRIFIGAADLTDPAHISMSIRR